METYRIFGRTDYAEPLQELGLLEAEGAALAEQASLERYGREWVELSLVPELEVVWVLREREADGDEHDDR